MVCIMTRLIIPRVVLIISYTSLSLVYMHVHRELGEKIDTCTDMTLWGLCSELHVHLNNLATSVTCNIFIMVMRL